VNLPTSEEASEYDDCLLGSVQISCIFEDQSSPELAIQNSQPGTPQNASVNNALPMPMPETFLLSTLGLVPFY
jgi:hypothetical protein